jgi:hypothetical protein
MFSVAGSDGDPTALLRDGKPILVLPEPESVLYRLLCPAYPARSPEQYTLGVEDLDGLVAVHEAAHKYQFICVQRLIERMLDNPTLIDAQPHRLFVIARLCDLPNLARKAALSTLKCPLFPTPVFAEMRLLTWEDAHRLYEFHRLCGVLARDIVAYNIPPPHDRCIFPLAGYEDPMVEPHFHHTGTNKQFFWWIAKNHRIQCRNGAPTPQGALRVMCP